MKIVPWLENHPIACIVLSKNGYYLHVITDDQLFFKIPMQNFTKTEKFEKWKEFVAQFNKVFNIKGIWEKTWSNAKSEETK